MYAVPRFILTAAMLVVSSFSESIRDYKRTSWIHWQINLAHIAIASEDLVQMSLFHIFAKLLDYDLGASRRRTSAL